MRLFSPAFRSLFLAAPAALLTVVLATAWLVVVPVFQSADEIDHFDYAYTLASARTLVRVTDGPVAYDPRVAALARVSDFFRIARHTDERVSSDYLTPRYVSRVERAVAPFASCSPLAPGAPRPKLAGVYPFFPYALYALALAPVHADPLAALFVARATNVALVAVGILAWGAVLRRLRLPAFVAGVVLLVVALFPLTAYVASYVQPDGVSFALVALLFALALRIRDEPAVPAFVAYGVLFAALCVTKQQYALVVGFATLLTVVVAALRTRRVALLTLVVVVPTALALAVDHAVMAGAPANYFHGPRTLTTALVEHLADLVPYLAHELQAAWGDFFWDGVTFRSYWGWFGWLDAPLQLGSPAITRTVLYVAVLGTNLAALGIVLSIAWRGTRLVRIGRRRSAASAFTLATRDPVFIAYVLFTLVMLTLWIASNDVFGGQGRNWFALEPAAWLVALRYAPLALPRRLRRAVVLIVALALAVYVLAAAPLALRTIVARYYGAPPPVFALRLTGPVPALCVDR